MLARVLELLSLAFFTSAPLLVICAIGQWVVQFRLIPEHNVPHLAGLRCIFYSAITAYVLGFFIWIFWPLHPDLVIYNNLSIPTIIAEVIAIPFWMKRFGYFKKSKANAFPYQEK